jgi:hypothetical protein
MAICLIALAFPVCAQVPSARFGLVNGLDIVETRHIPYTVGTHYGFRVDYHDTGKPVTLREEFHLPAPARWRSSSPSPQRMSSTRDERTMTREVQLGSHTAAPPDIHSLYIEDIKIALGDSKGEYTLKLWLNDRPFRDFQFRIE